MSFRIEYLSAVIEEDIPKLGTTEKRRIREAIEQKLTSAPRVFGKPLRYSKKGSWSLRVGDYRVIYVIKEAIVLVTVIGHRRDVYER